MGSIPARQLSPIIEPSNFAISIEWPSSIRAAEYIINVMPTVPARPYRIVWEKLDAPQQASSAASEGPFSLGSLFDLIAVAQYETQAASALGVLCGMHLIV